MARAAAAVASAVLVLSVAACRPGDLESASREWALERYYERGPTTVTLRVSRTQLTLADTLAVQLEVRAPEGYEVTLADAASFTDTDVLVREVRSDPPRLTGTDPPLVRVASTFTLRPFLPGDANVPALTVGWVDAADGASGQLQTDPIPLHVGSLLDNAGEPTLRAPSPPIRAPLRWGRIVAVGLAVAGLASLVALAYRRWRRSRPAAQEPVQSPTELALAGLRELEESDLLPRGDIKTFHTRVSAIVREYVEASSGLPALEQTTDEFLAAWRDAGSLGVEHRDALRRFLEQCDLVKFARAEPTQSMSVALIDTARRFVEAQDGAA